LGEVHQSNQILPICNSFIQSWASNSRVQRGAKSGKAPLKFQNVQKCLGEL